MTETTIPDEEKYLTYEEFMGKIRRKRPLPAALRIKTYQGERKVPTADRRRLMKEGLIQPDYRFPFLSVEKSVPGLLRISPPLWRINLVLVFRRMCLDTGAYREMCISWDKYTLNYDLIYKRKFVKGEREFTSWKDMSDHVSAYGAEYLKRTGLKPEDIKED